MGAKQTCELDELSDICELSKCIDHVEGKPSDSASPTDTWICTLQPNTTFKQKPIRKIFLKIGINPMYAANIETESIGLMYELRVYNEVITPLIDENVCPNFVRSLLVSNNCTFRSLFDTLKKGLSRLNLSDDEITDRLRRNFAHVANRQKMRPAIDTPSPPSPPSPESQDVMSLAAKFERLSNGNVPTNASARQSRQSRQPQPRHELKNDRIMLLATEFDHVETFGRWIQNNQDIQTNRLVLLQLLIALNAMACCKLCHNDLRPGNIFVQTLQRPTIMQYIINKKRFTIVTLYKLLVFDFDRASCVSLGENIMWSEYYEPRQPFETNRDLSQFIQALHPFVLPALDEVMTLPPKNERVQWFDARGTDIADSIVDIIDRLYALLPQLQWDDGVKPFVIDDSMFDALTGRLITSKVRVDHMLTEYSIATLRCKLELAKNEEAIREEAQLEKDLSERTAKFCRDIQPRHGNHPAVRKYCSGQK